MRRHDGAATPAKINLALVVGPRRPDGKHEVVTVYQRIRLWDRIWLDSGSELRVLGFPEDTLVQQALSALAARCGVEPRWRVYIEKRIPVAAGLGGGSSDAATALKWANTTLDRPLLPDQLLELAASIGADVPFFLVPGAQLGQGDGTKLKSLNLPSGGYQVLVLLPHDARKTSTAAVYEAFDRRSGERGFDQRRTLLLETLSSLRRARDFARLPRNDLASSPLAEELERLGAFRADVTGAGPAVYGLFEGGEVAARAARAVEDLGRTWITGPTDEEGLRVVYLRGTVDR